MKTKKLIIISVYKRNEKHDVSFSITSRINTSRNTTITPYVRWFDRTVLSDDGYDFMWGFYKPSPHFHQANASSTNG